MKKDLLDPRFDISEPVSDEKLNLVLALLKPDTPMQDTSWSTLIELGFTHADNLDWTRIELGRLGNEVERVYGENSLHKFATEFHLTGKTVSEYGKAVKRIGGADFCHTIRQKYPSLRFMHFRTATRCYKDNQRETVRVLIEAGEKLWSEPEMKLALLSRLGKIDISWAKCGEACLNVTDLHTEGDEVVATVRFNKHESAVLTTEGMMKAVFYQQNN